MMPRNLILKATEISDPLIFIRQLYLLEKDVFIITVSLVFSSILLFIARASVSCTADKMMLFLSECLAGV